MEVRNIRIRRRRNLPHWEVDEGTYFVTFRLHDAIPPGARRQRDQDERKRPMGLQEHLQLDRMLDRGHGAAWLRRPDIARMVFDALHFFHNDRYLLHSASVMANHVHSIFRTAPSVSLASVMHSWKSFTAKEANRMLGRTGTFWQDESFDSLIHDQNELDRAIRYVMENPTKAGLKGWPWTTVLSTHFRIRGGLD